MTSLSVQYGDLPDDLRALPLALRDRVMGALRVALEVDAPRWIQWSIAGGGAGATPGAHPATATPEQRQAARTGQLRRKTRSRRPVTARPAPMYRQPVDTGAYKDSWKAEVWEDGGTFYSATNPPLLSAVIESGRRPAWIPIEPLAEWVRRKLGVTDEHEARSIAFAISKHASENRRPGLKVLERALPHIQDAFWERVQTALQRPVSDPRAALRQDR